MVTPPGARNNDGPNRHENGRRFCRELKLAYRPTNPHRGGEVLNLYEATLPYAAGLLRKRETCSLHKNHTM